MATPMNDLVPRIRGLAAVGLALIGLAASLAACGSPAPKTSAAAAAAKVSAAARRTTCSQVSAVLSDGPDPGADPVGYAEAQILPLGQIRTPDAPLRTAIGRLARAYQAFFVSNGTSGAAKLAVASASKQVDALCPGATS
jgi:hypothetical protein